MHTEADIRAIVRDELERREFIESGRRFRRRVRREGNLIAIAIALNGIIGGALILWLGG